MRHCLLRKLRVCLVGVCHERHTPIIEHADALDLAPFCKMSRNDLLDVVRHMDSANVDGPVLAGKAAHTTHIIAVVAKLVPTEAVNVRVEDVVDTGKPV